ncbi:hypothetical protein MKX08_010467 [Trichoderma sp. CBMAI-0020]|nr:hypothetical protein MKX08_010467 [Trichoderma sp. CBMAI-0020]
MTTTTILIHSPPRTPVLGPTPTQTEATTHPLTQIKPITTTSENGTLPVDNSTQTTPFDSWVSENELKKQLMEEHGDFIQEDEYLI